MAELLEWFYDNAENKTYNSEAALSYAVQMPYYAGLKKNTAKAIANYIKEAMYMIESRRN